MLPETRCSLWNSSSARPWSRIGRWLVLAALVCVLGCSSPVTKENFHKITPGMPLADVEAILGPPHQNYQGVLTWKSGESRFINVVLDDRERVAEAYMEGL